MIQQSAAFCAVWIIDEGLCLFTRRWESLPSCSLWWWSLAPVCSEPRASSPSSYRSWCGPVVCPSHSPHWSHIWKEHIQYTAPLYSGRLFISLFYCQGIQFYIAGDKRQCWILTWTICRAEKQRINRVSLITQRHSTGTTQCKKCAVVRSRFICLIRPNRGLAVKYFPFGDNREQKQNFQVNYHGVFGGLKSQGEEVHAEVRYNSPQHCTDRVRAGQASPGEPG